VEVDRNFWRKVFEVNAEGPLRVAQAVAPVMRARGAGSIINIASMAALMGTAGLGLCRGRSMTSASD
jgi:NAD(P)-dependent dehydrogenase (short-subunit alcohol dehydrogenase family)